MKPFILLLLVLTPGVLPWKQHSVHEDRTEPEASASIQLTQYHPQVDQLRWKYLQQQVFDSKNTRRRPHAYTKRDLRKRRTMNFGLDHDRNLKLLHDMKDEEIQALTSLLGKEPKTQLDGLRRLLNQKDYTPITENMMDVANTQRQPNIKVEYASPDYYIRQQNALALAQLAGQLNQVPVQPIFVTFAPEDTTPQYPKAEQHENEEQTHAADEQYHHYQHHEVQQHEEAAPEAKRYASKYAFGYQVKDFHTGNNFGHEETGDGKTAKGHYHVLLPDGRMQNVQYWADHTGYHAKVSYDTVARH